MKNRLAVAAFFILFSVSFLLVSQTADARRGCCSHHGGVCGCRCCDGTGLSAKCAPYYPECSSSNSGRLRLLDPSESGKKSTCLSRCLTKGYTKEDCTYICSEE